MMDSNTLSYIKSRFSDYYSEADFDPPKDVEQREFGYIPFNTGMIRHIGIEEIVDINDFLSEKTPEHSYVSASKFERPGEKEKELKNWQGSDLVFDVDAKDIPKVGPETPHKERLEIAKNEIKKVQNLVENSLGYDDYILNFSGNQGYHLHVTNDEVQNYTSHERTELAKYIQLNDIELDDLLMQNRYNLNESIKMFKPTGYSSEKFYKHTKSYLKSLNSVSREKAKEKLTDIDGIGDKKADNILNSIDRNLNLIKIGVIDTSDGLDKLLSQKVIPNMKEKEKAYIDQPVTTDENRLMRLRGSLHGESCLIVKKIDDIDNFSPLDDAVPEEFVDSTVEVKVNEKCSIYRLGSEHTFEQGEQELEDYLAIPLMLQGKAEKL